MMRLLFAYMIVGSIFLSYVLLTQFEEFVRLHWMTSEFLLSI